MAKFLSYLQIEAISRAQLDDKELDDLDIEAISRARLDDKELDQRGNFVNKPIHVFKPCLPNFAYP